MAYRPLCGSSRSALCEIWEGSLEEATASKAPQGKWDEEQSREGTRAVCRSKAVSVGVTLPSRVGFETFGVYSTDIDLAHSGLSVEKLLRLQRCVRENC